MREIRLRVAVCLVDRGRILLVVHEKEGRQYRLLPGGGVEVGETLADATRRELAEETGYQVEVGRLVIIAESIEPDGRHLVNLVFAGRITGGELRVGCDHRLVGAEWQPIDALTELPMHPPIGAVIHACFQEGFDGPVRMLGNVWTSV